jgi:exonuclease VII large subunit
MKKITQLLIIAAVAGLAACNKENRGAEQSVKNLETYVDSIERDHVNYYTDNNYWANVEAGYEEKRQQVEARSAQLNEKLKAEYAQLQENYAALKERYNAERSKARDYRIVLRNALFGEGVVGDDMSFGFMTAANAATTYETFVNTVESNKDLYTREDWDEIKVLYEAMDTRKNEIEKDLTAKDNRTIAGQKIRFAAIRTVNRPNAKVKENADAKR